MVLRPSLPPPALRLGKANPSTSGSGRSGFALHTVTGLHRPELHHYYGVICTSPHHCLGLRLEALTALSMSTGVRLPRLLQPASCTIDVLKHRQYSLTEYRLCAYLHAYPSLPPNQVRFGSVPSGFPSGFLQTPPGWAQLPGLASLVLPRSGDSLLSGWTSFLRLRREPHGARRLLFL